MMLPAIAGWPPNIFTPKRLLFESRPFFTLPSPFLCAIKTKFKKLEIPNHKALLEFGILPLEFFLSYLSYPDFSIMSTMTFFLAETFTAFLLVSNHLVAFYLVQDLCADLQS